MKIERQKVLEYLEGEGWLSYPDDAPDHEQNRQGVVERLAVRVLARDEDRTKMEGDFRQQFQTVLGKVLVQLIDRASIATIVEAIRQGVLKEEIPTIAAELRRGAE